MLPQDCSFLVSFNGNFVCCTPPPMTWPRCSATLELTVEGATALYDAIAFSKLQCKRQPVRKASVNLGALACGPTSSV